MTPSPDRGRLPPAPAIILVGHGRAPSDCPPALIAELRRLKTAARLPDDPELLAAESRIRHWPRTTRTDPYQAGLEEIAAALRAQLAGHRIATAYNEFCAPSLAEAIDEAAAAGCRSITVLTVMLTRGGSHSEEDIPREVAQAGRRHPGVEVRYAWPYAPASVAGLLATQAQKGARPAI
ncbi:MAG: CbiX/SirB N-terminal domain-containing protein [Elusimicrobiota bacterium]|jgi:sirohydrochlorin cobaltochelatase